MFSEPAKRGRIRPRIRLTFALLRRSHQFAQIRLLVDLHQHVTGVHEFPRAFGGEQETCGISPVSVQ